MLATHQYQPSAVALLGRSAPQALTALYAEVDEEHRGLILGILSNNRDKDRLAQMNVGTAVMLRCRPRYCLTAAVPFLPRSCRPLYSVKGRMLKCQPPGCFLLKPRSGSPDHVQPQPLQRAQHFAYRPVDLHAGVAVQAAF